MIEKQHNEMDIALGILGDKEWKEIKFDRTYYPTTGYMKADNNTP